VLPFLPQELTSKDNGSVCGSEVQTNETLTDSLADIRNKNKHY